MRRRLHWSHQLPSTILCMIVAVSWAAALGAAVTRYSSGAPGFAPLASITGSCDLDAFAPFPGSASKPGEWPLQRVRYMTKVFPRVLLDPAVTYITRAASDSFSGTLRTSWS